MSINKTDKTCTSDQLKKYKGHLLGRAYMSGIARDKDRIKETAEVFTPNNMVRELVRRVGLENINDPEKRIIDTSCGDGQFLAYILYRRLKAGVPFQKALLTLYGVDIKEDNVEVCRTRLLCGEEHLRYIVKKNIVATDALDYDYVFDGRDPEIEPKMI